MSPNLYVVVFAFDPREREVLLMSKQRPDWQRGLLNGVGGRVEDGETIEDAALREFEEEVGDPITGLRLVCQLTSGDDIIYFFRAVCEAPLPEGTDESVLWCDPDALPESCIPNLRWLIPMARARQRHDWPFTACERAKEVR